MTGQTTPRYGFSMFLMVAALVAIAIGSSVWAKAGSQPMISDDIRIDISAVMMSAHTASLPVEYFADPF